MSLLTLRIRALAIDEHMVTYANKHLPMKRRRCSNDALEGPQNPVAHSTHLKLNFPALNTSYTSAKFVSTTLQIQGNGITHIINLPQMPTIDLIPNT
jgi:hypothetical protein